MAKSGYQNRRRQNERESAGHEIDLQSGFTVRVKPLPPYYKDLINDNFPLRDYPTRKIRLAAGDVVDWPYKPSEEEPSKDDEDYDLWITWHAVDRDREDTEKQRTRARNDFLLANCVEVLEGPVDFEDDEWVYKVEAAFQEQNYTVPEHPGARLLVFLKTQVITDPTEFEVLVQLSIAPEVRMQGVLNALRGFQGDMGQGGIVDTTGLFSGRETEL